MQLMLGQSRDAPIAVFVQIVSRQLQTLWGPPSPDPRRGAELVYSDLIKVAWTQLGRGDAGAAWDGTGGFARALLLFTPARSHWESRCGFMDAAAPLEHPGANLGGRRSWPTSAQLPAVHPCPATLFISPAIRMPWVTLPDGLFQKFIFITPRSCVHLVPEEGAATLHGDTSPAVCNPAGFVPPRVPSRDPQVPGDLGASRAFSAIDCPMCGCGVMTGLIFALRHSSAYFFEISRWGDKLRHSAGRAGVVGPGRRGGQGAAPAPHVLAVGRAPGSMPCRAGAPSSPGAFFPSFLPFCRFSLRPKANSRVPAQFG